MTTYRFKVELYSGSGHANQQAFARIRTVNKAQAEALLQQNFPEWITWSEIKRLPKEPGVVMRYLRWLLSALSSENTVRHFYLHSQPRETLCGLQLSPQAGYGRCPDCERLLTDIASAADDDGGNLVALQV